MSEPEAPVVSDQVCPDGALLVTGGVTTGGVTTGGVTTGGVITGGVGVAVDPQVGTAGSMNGVFTRLPEVDPLL